MVTFLYITNVYYLTLIVFPAVILSLLIPFNCFIRLTVVPYLRAIVERVSPFLTL